MHRPGSSWRKNLKPCAAVVLAAMAVLTAGKAWSEDAAKGGDMPIDLTSAVVMTPGDLSPRELKAVDLLLDEVEKRTRIRWTVVHEWPADAPATVAVVPKRSVESLAGPLRDLRHWDPKPEGYTRQILPGGVTAVVGADERGVLFGVGRLLRDMVMEPNRITLTGSCPTEFAPAFPLRGHQMGYRPKTNSYDAWDVPVWEQYIRDLAVFGTNAIEVMPPRTDDDADSPHFPLPQIDMIAHQSRIADELGLDVWVWYPAMDKDYSDPATVEAALKEWGDVFAKIPRIDAVFVPGGDPGHTQPKHLLALLEKETEVLHRTHPNAQMWVSPQSFTQEWLDEFFEILNTQQPKWLSGIVFGPQNRNSLEDLRARVPKQYPIRHYPDITHTVRCQFPVPEWDVAYSLTEHREPINPRPVDYANIFRQFSEGTNGFITYSEGCNDDFNKILWSSLGWAPHMSVEEIAREYARYFVGARFEEGLAQGILALERNWRGPILTNKGIFTTLAQFQAMEQAATPEDLLNWRFQQLLYRAYYDAYDARRLTYETELEEQAMDILRQAGKLGATKALDDAEAALDRAEKEPVAQELRAKVFQLGDDLYKSIRMQLSKPLYQAIDPGRGANLDYIDTPLNDRLWLKARFAEIRNAANDEDRLKAIDAIVNWTNPGPGGFYDDLGNLTQQPHLVPRTVGILYSGDDPNILADYASSPSWKYDTEFRRSALVGFNYVPEWRMSWVTHAESRYDAPLQMCYDTLDPNAEYKLRITYAGDKYPKVRLVADGAIENDRIVQGVGYELHPWIQKPQPTEPVEVDIPREAVADGQLILLFEQEAGQGGGGRGCQVAEVWLIKK